VNCNPKEHKGSGRRMKILFGKNCFGGPASGADEIAVTYAIELKASGHSTSMLLVQRPAIDDALAARLRDADVPLTTLASSTLSISMATGRKLAISAMQAFSPASELIRTNARSFVIYLLERYYDACCEFLKRERPDVLHVMTPDPGAVMLVRAAHATGVPVIYQEVGLPFHPPGFEEVYQRLVAVLPLCSGVAALSPTLAQAIGRVMPHLDAPFVLPLISQDAANGALHSNGSGSESVRFGFAARLEHLKGPVPLIKGFSIAHSMRPNIELKLAGNGSQRQEIIQRIQRLGLEEKCHLVGVYKSLNERSEFMRGIDVFVLPSQTEGTPNAIIEAMSHGKPIIATSVGGIPDVVSPDAGILVPLNDVQALGAAMTTLATDADLRRRMGLAARQKYEQLFTPRVVLPLLTHFYEQAVNRSRAIGNGRSRPQEEQSHPWFGL